MILEQDLQNSSRIFSAHPDRTAWRAVGEESVLLDLDSSVYFGLNRSAGLLWSGLLTGSSFDELVELLRTSGTPPASRDRAEAEVLTFLQMVDAEQLIQVSDADD